MKRILPLLLSALLSSSSAFAADFGQAVTGFVYFHKPGADSAAHNAALERCSVDAARAFVPSLPATGLAEYFLNGWADRGIAHATFVANMENCMVTEGWTVMKLDDAEGKRIASLPESEVAAVLAPMIGAATPPGTPARHYEPIDKLGFGVPQFGDSGHDSLSFLSHRTILAERVKDARLPPMAKAFTQAEEVRDLRKIPADAALLVASATCKRGCGSMTFVRLADEGGAAQWLGHEFPTGFLKSDVTTETHVYVVTPGRWRIGNINAVDFCLGNASFEIKPGEAVYAGSFGGATAFAPMTLNLEAAKAALGPLADRLVLADYRNGDTASCGAWRQQFTYVYEVPGAPFIEGYARGSQAH